MDQKDKEFLGIVAGIALILLAILALFLHFQFLNKTYSIGFSGCAAMTAFFLFTRRNKRYLVGMLIGMVVANGMALANSIFLSRTSETCEVVGVYGEVQHAAKKSLASGIERIKVKCGDSSSEVHSFLTESRNPSFGSNVVVMRGLLGYKKI